MSAKQAQTKPGTVRLSEVARHVVVPSGVVASGWPAVRDKCAEFGISFRPWQPDVGRLILAKRDDGKYAATIGGTALSIPRQVGKTFLVGAIVFALCLLRPNLTVIWTAHRLRTAEETFGKMQGFAKRKRIKPDVLKVIRGSGDEAVIFRNGSRILFGARERGFGRGFDEVDVLIFDEAQILTENAIDDMIPATNQSRQEAGALLLFMGTPPKPDDRGEVFARMRAEALSGDDEDTGYIEFSADPGFHPSESPAPMTAKDWAQIAKANPSYPQDTPREAILRMRKKLTPESMRREGYGIWDETADVFEGGWSACRIDAEPPMDRLSIGLAVSLSRQWSSLGVASRIDGVPVLGAQRRERGWYWVVPECRRLHETYGVAIAVDELGPADFLIPKLQEAGVPVNAANTADYCAACSDLYALVKQTADARREHPEAPPALYQLGHDELDLAILMAVWREVGDGRRAWGRRKSSGDISMLEAVTLALWDLTNDVLPAIY